MDRIEAIVDRAIALTDWVLDTHPEHRIIAVESLLKLRSLLAAALPCHPALKTIDAYVAKFRRPN